MGRLQDKVVVVTGAANGLGEATALRLSQDGAKLVLADIDGSGLAKTAAVIRSDGGEVVTVVGDITEEVPAAELVDAALTCGGGTTAAWLQTASGLTPPRVPSRSDTSSSCIGRARAATTCRCRGASTGRPAT